MIGTVGKSLPISSAIKFSLSEMTCSSQTQNDLKRVFYQMSQTQFLSRLIKSAHFPSCLIFRQRWTEGIHTRERLLYRRYITPQRWNGRYNNRRYCRCCKRRANKNRRTEPNRQSCKIQSAFENRRRTLRYRAIRKILIIKTADYFRIVCCFFMIDDPPYFSAAPNSKLSKPRTQPQRSFQRTRFEWFAERLRKFQELA